MIPISVYVCRRASRWAVVRNANTVSAWPLGTKLPSAFIMHYFGNGAHSDTRKRKRALNHQSIHEGSACDADNRFADRAILWTGIKVEIN